MKQKPISAAPAEPIGGDELPDWVPDPRDTGDDTDMDDAKKSRRRRPRPTKKRCRIRPRKEAP